MYLTVGNAIDPQTGKAREMPWAYQELVLCRDVYHCTPSQLAAEDWETVREHLRLLAVEQRAHQAKRA